MKSKTKKIDPIYRLSRMTAYGSIMSAVIFIISIQEWFGRSLNIFISVILLVFLVVLVVVARLIVIWLITSRAAADSKESLLTGDYSEEASKTSFKYGWVVIFLFLVLLFILNALFGIDFSVSIIIKLSLAITVAVPSIAYLLLTREKEESDER